jgi:hypothetical protein
MSRGSLTVFVAGTVLASLACEGGDRPSVIEDLSPAVLLVEDPELHGVKDVRPTADGGLVVLSRYAPYLRWYDRDGRLRCVNGYAGSGPGEFRYPWAFVRHAPEPAVSDPNLRRLTTVPGCGGNPTPLRFPDVVPDARRDLPDLTYGDPYQVAFIGGDFAASSYPAPINQASGMLPAVIVRIAAGGTLGDTLASFTDVPGRDDVVRGARWLLPIPLWDSCPGGELVTYDGLARELHVAGPPPALRRAVPLPAHLTVQRPLVTEEVRAHIRHTLILEYLSFQDDTAEVDARADEVVREARAWFGHQAPAITRVLCDDRSRLWLQEFDLYDDPTGRSARWTLLDGARVHRFRFPPSFQPRTIARGQALGVLVDRFGVETLAAVAVP